MDGLFKTLATKVLNHVSDKTINESGLTEEQKWAMKAQVDQGIDLVSNNFEDNVKSGIKATIAFIQGMKGGPIAAFAAAASVGVKESAINQQKFVRDAMARGIPVTFNGQLINPPTIEENEKVINYSAIAAGGVSVLMVGGVLYWMLSD